MRAVLNRQQIRDFDRVWIERGVPGIVLMENAGRGAAHLIGLKLKPRAAGAAPRTGSSVAGSCIRCADEKALSGGSILVLCGPGNNGGDGFVVARHLAARSAQVTVICTVDPASLRGDAALAHQALSAMGIATLRLPPSDSWPDIFANHDLVVDALLGTGATRELQGELREFVLALNQSESQVISLDVPTGLDAESGAILGACVKAFHTVSFAHLKTGLLTTRGHEFAGTITVSHIGVPSAPPDSLQASAWLLEEQDVRGRYQARSPVAHKGDSGRVLIVAGSPGTLGAARLVAHGAHRAGAGLVTLAGSAGTVERLEGSVRESMTLTLEPVATAQEVAAFRAADAFVVGPGLGQSDESLTFVQRVLAAGRPTVLDADALRLLAQHGANLLGAAASQVVLTPHAGEAASLLEWSAEQVESDRFAASAEICRRYGCTVILKGTRPIIAQPGALPRVSAFGTQALATGGSGDVLAGVLGAFMVHAEGLPAILHACEQAVVVQGLAAEKWSQANGTQGLLASEIADLVPQVLSSWTR